MRCLPQSLLVALALPLAACSERADEPTDAGTLDAAVCERSVYSRDCCQVPHFQCGFSSRCEAGLLKASWHEHVFCAGQEHEEIVDYSCETACPAGCEEGEIQDWPANGEAFCAAHCAEQTDGGEPDGGDEDGGDDDGGEPDAGDAGTSCLFGHDQTCNDDLTVSSYEGSCRADGTCACNSGFELNPATGRCRWAGDAGNCEPPQYSTNCCEVPSFQCGFAARCEAGTIHVSWHEHVFCGPPPEQIVPYECSVACANGCTEGQIMAWPPNGEQLCSDLCL
jgi:hypothetical protein